MFARTPLDVAVETCGALASFEPELLARTIPLRTLYIHGADDQVVPVEISQRCAASMDDGSVSVVEECGHLVVLDQPEALRNLVHEFVAAPTPRSARP
jgi:pimeloyl-ACP methyl ester carboxylesterase